MSMAAPQTRSIAWVDGHVEHRVDRRADPHPGHHNMWALWYDAVEIDSPLAGQDGYARYHPWTGLVLVARWGWLQTAILLEDRPEWEQEHVREQLEDDSTL